MNGDRDLFGIPVTEAELLLLSLALIALAGFAFFILARLLLGGIGAATNVPQPVTTLISVLGILSVVALIGALFTSSESAYTIAATGVGAFAGALTAKFGSTTPTPQATDDDTDDDDTPTIAPITHDDDHGV